MGGATRPRRHTRYDCVVSLVSALYYFKAVCQFARVRTVVCADTNDLATLTGPSESVAQCASRVTGHRLAVAGVAPHQ